MRAVMLTVVAVAAATAVSLLIFSQGANVVLYELVVATVALVALVVLRHRSPERVTDPDEERNRGKETIPPELAKLERVVRFGRTTELDADRRMLRLLRQVARDLLVSRYGIDPDVEPDEAAALLGDEAWDWLRPGRPVDRMRPGIEIDDVETIVAALERLQDS